MKLKLAQKIGIIAMCSIALTACSTDRTINIPKISSDDMIYYNKLDEFDLSSLNWVEEYIQIYVQYNNKVIPDKELQIITSRTEKELYDSTVSNEFINTCIAQKIIGTDGEEYYGEAGQFGNDSVLDGEEYIDEEPKYSGDVVVNVAYSYRESTYIAKINSTQGNYYNILFKVEDNKVVKIDEE